MLVVLPPIFVGDTKIICGYNSVASLSLNAMKSVGHQIPKKLEMLLRGETNFFVRSLRHYSVLIFNFSDIKRGYKIKIRIVSQVFSKILRNQRA